MQAQHPMVQVMQPIQNPEQTPLSFNNALTVTNETAIKGPDVATFKLPAKPIEHEQMIEKIMQGGLMRSEAEQSISARKSLFNKACKEFKKNKNSQQKGIRKAIKKL
jgi:hypothetical protein